MKKKLFKELCESIKEAGLILRLKQKDEHHTKDELYIHRHMLFGALIKLYGGWKSLKHNDGTMYDGWFIAGCYLPSGMITYHLPIIYFEDFPAQQLDAAPRWDGYTSDDVCNRLYEFWKFNKL